MGKKIVWLVVSCLMVAALVLASCAPAVTEEEEEITAPAEEEEEVTPPAEEEEAAGPEMESISLERVDGSMFEGTREKPRYGGTIVMVRADDPRDFDEAFQNTWTTWTLGLTNDNLVLSDWSRGPSGTNEYPNLMASNLYPSLTEGLKGHLAESWEYPDPYTHVYHIRQGVHWALNPDSEASRLVNGRELTAEDAGYSVRRVFEMPGGWLYTAPIKPVSYEYPDKYTLVLRFTEFEAYMIMRTAGITYAVPREVVEQNDGEGLRDWRNSVGTGPFMLMDYVNGNALYFDRNPDYWERDPFNQANQLPYADHFKIVIIPDLSTRLAALRAGKIDQLMDLSWEQRQSLLTTNPELKERTQLGKGMYYGVRMDTKPFDDVKVRRALSMAIDREAFRDYYHGFSEELAYPVPPETTAQYTPMEELPDDIRETLEYHPDKARQLLADAGYPNGFKMTVNTVELYTDLVALTANMWEAIGIEVEIKVNEPAVQTSIYYAKNYTDVYASFGRGGFGESFLVHNLADSTHNMSIVRDPWYDEKCLDAIATVDGAERDRKLKALNVYVLENMWRVFTPVGSLWVFWQPWLKQYTGEISMGYCHWWKPMAYAWVDQDLKESITGTRD